MPLTPIEIKKYSAIVNQTGTNPPVITILQNEIGNIIWTRNSQGRYYGTLTGAFPPTRTQLYAQQSAAVDRQVIAGLIDEDTVLLFQPVFTNPWDPVDELVNVTLEIRVYHTQPITIIPND